MNFVRPDSIPEFGVPVEILDDRIDYSKIQELGASIAYDKGQQCGVLSEIAVLCGGTAGTIIAGEPV